jgi:hypothetical protein
MDAIEIGKILLTSAVTTIFTGILAFTYQKLFVERRLLEGVERLKAELQSARELESRQAAFAARQLEEFYAPMVGCLRKLRAKSDLRLEISKTSDVAWQEICERNPKPFIEHGRYFEPFQKSIEYDNKQLREEILPLYDEMLSVFTRKYWLANPATRQWYPELTAFVELWYRWLDASIPGEVIEKMDHKEETLGPLYKDLEDQPAILHEKLSEG